MDELSEIGFLEIFNLIMMDATYNHTVNIKWATDL